MLPLTTLENVKTLLKNPDPNLDPLIESFINTFSQAAADYCLREFDSDVTTEYFDGGTSTIFLNRRPVTKIVNIWVDDNWVWGDTKLIPTTDYRLVNAATGMVHYRLGVWYPSAFPKGPIKVVYEGGYDSPPDDLEMAIRTQVAYKIKRREDVGLVKVSFPDGSVQKRIVDEFLPEVVSVLDRYSASYIG